MISPHLCSEFVLGFLLSTPDPASFLRPCSWLQAGAFPSGKALPRQEGAPAPRPQAWTRVRAQRGLPSISTSSWQASLGVPFSVLSRVVREKHVGEASEEGLLPGRAGAGAAAHSLSGLSPGAGLAGCLGSLIRRSVSFVQLPHPWL